MTGCHNRRFFEEIDRREMERHRRYDRPPSVVFVDLDRFKHLNDSSATILETTCCGRRRVPKDAETLAEAIRLADAQMYRDKTSERARV